MVAQDNATDECLNALEAVCIISLRKSSALNGALGFFKYQFSPKETIFQKFIIFLLFASFYVTCSEFSQAQNNENALTSQQIFVDPIKLAGPSEAFF